MGRKTWVELNLRSNDERDLRVVSDPADCCRRQDEVDLLQRELDDTTDQLVVACLQRIELEKTVRSSADRIRELEARLGETAPTALTVVPSGSTVSGNDVAIDVTDRGSVRRNQPADGSDVGVAAEPAAASALPDRDSANRPADDSADRFEKDCVYVFDEGDSVGEAFDQFFAAPDPHLDKIRRFLLG